MRITENGGKSEFPIDNCYFCSAKRDVFEGWSQLFRAILTEISKYLVYLQHSRAETNAIPLLNYSII